VRGGGFENPQANFAEDSEELEVIDISKLKKAEE
jgi:hypothetical protein